MSGQHEARRLKTTGEPLSLRYYTSVICRSSHQIFNSVTTWWKDSQWPSLMSYLRKGIRAIRRGERFDLIITDINMPGTTTGLDLAKEVRSVDPNAKIAIMTGRPAGEAADLCDLYLKKPFLEVGSLFQRLMVDAA